MVKNKTPEENTTDRNIYLKRWLGSQERAAMLKSRQYYAGVQDILKKQRTVLERDVLVPIKHVSNNQITINLFRKIVDQKVRYITAQHITLRTQGEDVIDMRDPSTLDAAVEDLTNNTPPNPNTPPTPQTQPQGVQETHDENFGGSKNDAMPQDLTSPKTDTPEEQEPSPADKKKEKTSKFIRLVNCLFGPRFLKQLGYGLIDVIIEGDGWIYVYIDEDGYLQLEWMRSSDVYPIYTDNRGDNISTMYRVVRYIDTAGKNKQIIEEYGINGRTTYDADAGISDRGLNMRATGSDSYITTIPAQLNPNMEVQHFAWESMPFLHIKTTGEPIPLLNRCKSLVDAINTIISNLVDQINDNPDGHILKIVNAGGDKPSKLRDTIIKNRIVHLTSSKEEPQTSAEFMADPVLVDAYDKAIDKLALYVYACTGGFNDQNESLLGANIHEEVISAAMMTIDQDARMLITSLEDAFTRIIREFYVPYLLVNGHEDYSDVGISVHFEKTLNQVALAQELVSLGLKVSNRTLLEHFPWIEDVDDEIKRLNEEAEQNMMDNMQNNPFMQKNTVNTGSPNGGGKPQDIIDDPEGNPNSKISPPADPIPAR